MSSFPIKTYQEAYAGEILSWAIYVAKDDEGLESMVSTMTEDYHQLVWNFPNA